MKLLEELWQRHGHASIKKLTLELQQFLIDGLPDDYDVSLAKNEGSADPAGVCVRVAHSSYTKLVGRHVLLEPRRVGSVYVTFAPISGEWRELIYNSADVNANLCSDLQKVIPSNTL